MNEINRLEDLYDMLDSMTEGISWDDFYAKRDKPAPFLKFSNLPDKLLVDFMKDHKVKDAIEFGCGEGRNAVYLGQKGIMVDAYDLSKVAIANAKKDAQNYGLRDVSFTSGNVFEVSFGNQYDLVIDSGMFHHLFPHRRLHYREILKHVLKKEGYFLLICFASGEDGGDDIDDYAVYKQKQLGVTFTPRRIRDFFGDDFDIISIEQCEELLTDEYMENPYLYKCVMKKK